MLLIQELHTSGARAVETFFHQNERYLVVPQLAHDIAAQPAGINSGDSDIDALVFRWDGTQFLEHARIPVAGGEDAEFFRIGERAFLATASLRSGQSPYALNVQSTIFEIVDGHFEPFQRIATFAAKQWKQFSIDGRHFLALAQGVTMEGATAAQPSESYIYEWDGARFNEFQRITSAWGYNWAFFKVGSERLLAYADHVERSRLLRWNGEKFEDFFQELDGTSGRAFCFFEHGGSCWLAFANLHGDSLLYRWVNGRFAKHQTLSGPGGRELRWLDTAAGGRLVQVNFIHGSREAPITKLQSFIYRFDGEQMIVDEEFPTLGGTDCCAFESGGQRYLVVANSLNAELRFRTPCSVYRIEHP